MFDLIGNAVLIFSSIHNSVIMPTLSYIGIHFRSYLVIFLKENIDQQHVILKAKYTRKQRTLVYVRVFGICGARELLFKKLQSLMVESIELKAASGTPND